jgi:oligoendopeptidase F
MHLLPFENLPAYRRRTFVPEHTNLGKWAELFPLFDRLEADAARADTAAELEKWLLNWGELSAALDEEGARRYIAMTCHTDNDEAEKAYLHFVEQIEPELKPRQFALARLLVTHPLTGSLPEPRYAVLLRDARVQVELFRPENVALETEEARLSQQYQKLSGSLTVQFRGEEKTLVQMSRYQEETDRALREEAWQAVARRRLAERDAFEDIFDRLITLRGKIAANAGFANYRDYAFRRLGRFDYGPQDCVQFHDAVEQEVMPILRRMQSERHEQLRVEPLRPWDMGVDPQGRPPLKPFTGVEEMMDRTQAIFDQLDGELADGLRQMRTLKLLDLANRKGKAPGGYQSTLAEARLPFIFMNAVGLQRDVETILHEAGHAFHALATREEDVYAYRNAPIEFCEVASMSMELLGNEHVEQFYAPAEAQRARRVHLEGIIAVLAWIAAVDAFQHWIYTHPGHARAERAAAWAALMDRFGGEADWSGWEEARSYLWHRQLHIFIHPFYYIEYGIAQLGALRVWANAKRDRAGALQAYKAALKLGGSRPLPELFAAAGCPFDFSRKAVAPLAGLVAKELAALPA